MKLLIDCDYIVYKCCAATETEIDFGEDLIIVTSNYSEAYKRVKREIQQVQDEFMCDDVILFFTSPINFRKKIGSKVVFYEFRLNMIKFFSITSHLPHLIAYNLIKTAQDSQKIQRKNLIQYSAGGLRDFSRIAASNEVMWRDIFIDNSENILKVLDSFSENLQEIKKAIQSKNTEKLNDIFSSTRKLRKEIIKAGQETDKPNFGRKYVGYVNFKFPRCCNEIFSFS